MNYNDDVSIVNVKRMLLNYQREIGIDLCFQDFEHELQTFPKIYLPPAGCVLLAFDTNHGNTSPIGMIALKGLPLDALAKDNKQQENARCANDTIGEMKRLWIEPDHRGSGIGYLLVKVLLDKSKEKRYRLIRLDTLHHMVAAHRVYERFGFKRIEKYNNNPIDKVCFYELDLMSTNDF